MMNDEEHMTLIPTSGMSFETQVLILRAYIVLSDMGETPVHLKTVMKRTKLARSQISGVNSFFVGLGLLIRSGQGTYNVPKQVVSFLGERPGDEDYQALSTPMRGSALYDFLKKALMIYGSVTWDEAIDYLLEESESKTKSRAERALQWLEKTGLLRTDGNNIILL